MRHKISASKNNSGMTMVEVLMGFVILVILLGLVSGIIVVSTNIYYSSVDLERAEESLQEALYSKSITDSLPPETEVIKLVPTSDMPGTKTPITMSCKMYKLSSSMVLEGEEAESLNVDIYFLKKP